VVARTIAIGSCSTAIVSRDSIEGEGLEGWGSPREGEDYDGVTGAICADLPDPPRRGKAIAAPFGRYVKRCTIIFLISAIAFAGFRPLGQVLVQFMMVWQR
jgi:hypothetical protein